MGSAAVIVSEADHRWNRDAWNIVTSLVLDGISSRHTRRPYSQALDEFLIWFHDDHSVSSTKPLFKSTVQNWRRKGWRPPALTSGCLQYAA
jgi:hypothetical protein